MAVKKGSDNEFPSVLFAEQGSDPAIPAAGTRRLYVTSAGAWEDIDDAGTVTAVGAGFANPMTTSGDIIYGAASGAPTRLAKSTDGKVLTLASGVPSWATPSSGFSDPMTTRGDVIVRNASNVTDRLAIGSSGKVLSSNGTDVSWQTPASGVPTLHGCQARLTGSPTLGFVGEEGIPLTGTDEYDTDGYHFTSDSNLTGTVTKASGSPSIVGSGTSFTTELTVNQVISIPGTAAEIGVVKTITDNTHLDLWSNMANSASGQTATRKSSYMACPAGLGGLYAVTGMVTITAVHTAVSYLRIDAGGVTTFSPADRVIKDMWQYGTSSFPLRMVPGDWVFLKAINNSGSNRTLRSETSFAMNLVAA